MTLYYREKRKEVSTMTATVTIVKVYNDRPTQDAVKALEKKVKREKARKVHRR